MPTAYSDVRDAGLSEHTGLLESEDRRRPLVTVHCQPGDLSAFANFEVRPQRNPQRFSSTRWSDESINSNLSDERAMSGICHSKTKHF
jgi:hypothetical protein